MDWVTGVITRFELDPYGRTAAWIECPARVIPATGQYILAWAKGDESAPLAQALFPSVLAPDGFQTSRLPPHWGLGNSLKLRGPLGHGFKLPPGLRHLALASLGEGGARLRPLMDQALAQNLEVALFEDHLPHGLSPAVEAYPLSGLAQALAWADFLAVDVPHDKLAQLSQIFGPRNALQQPLPAAQALVAGPMPCGATADCGVCAVQTRHNWKLTSWKLTCKDGPVFDLEELDW
jgi:Iron-sulfur cluster binding domain of dihydroorotate dehydrogenase B